MISSLPRDQILLETDCPYMPAVVGEDSEPAPRGGTAQYAAELWKVTLEEAQAQLERNFEALFPRISLRLGQAREQRLG